MITYDVFDDLFQLRNVVDRYFDEVPSRVRYREFPFVSFYEANDEITVKAIMPGVKPDSLSLNLVDTSLIIEGEKKYDYTDNPYIRKERLFGKFKKSIKLPYRVKGDAIKAELKNGILTIELTRSEDTKPKRIEIK